MSSKMYTKFSKPTYLWNQHILENILNFFSICFAQQKICILIYFLNLIYFTRIAHSSLAIKCFAWLKNCEYPLYTDSVTPYSSDRLSGSFYMPRDRIQYMGPRFQVSSERPGSFYCWINKTNLPEISWTGQELKPHLKEHVWFSHYN